MQNWLNARTGILIVSLIILLSGCVIQVLWGYCGADQAQCAWGNDDAYISYRFAHNFAQGDGLVFNPGERVEGYSNFLYVLLLSPAARVFTDVSLYFFSAFLNIVLGAASLLVFHYQCQKRLGGTYAAIAVLLFALFPPLWLWAAAGMETLLVLLLMLLIFASVDQLHSRDALPILCISLVLSILARADGFVLVAIVGLYLLLKRQWRVLWAVGITVSFTLIVYIGWRYSYYGDVLPNTFYAKVTGGLLYRFVYATILLVNVNMRQGLFIYLIGLSVAAFMLAAGVLTQRVNLTRSLRLEVLFAVGWVAYWFYIGGDGYLDRFLIVLLPPGIIVFLEALKKHDPQLTRGWVRLSVLLVILVQMGALVTDPRFQYSATKYDTWLTLGAFLKQHTGQTLAIDAAGKAPYLSNLMTLDMLGLNDKIIAHEDPKGIRLGHSKYDAEYVLQHTPDLIAAWTDADFNLSFGLDRTKYEQAGYRLKYLIYANHSPPQTVLPTVLDVSDMPEAQIHNLIEQDYNYAILQRIGKAKP